MLPLQRKRTSARWPFWLLMAAWFCANSPQAVTYELIIWLGNARHFTHQQRLHTEVASVLAAHALGKLFATAKAAPERPFAPPIPADATLKKIELAVHRTSELLPPALRAVVWADLGTAPSDALCEPPPHEPPRMGLTA